MNIDRQPEESVTALTIRRIRAEIIEECAKAIENYNPDRNWSADPDMQNQGYFTAGEVQWEIVDLVRALAVTHPNRDTKQLIKSQRPDGLNQEQ